MTRRHPVQQTLVAAALARISAAPVQLPNPRKLHTRYIVVACMHGPREALARCAGSYCPPTSNSAWVICPRLQQRIASINTANAFWALMTACCRRCGWFKRCNCDRLSSSALRAILMFCCTPTRGHSLGPRVQSQGRQDRSITGPLQDRRDDLQLTAAVRAVLHVDLEHPLEQRSGRRSAARPARSTARQRPQPASPSSWSAMNTLCGSSA